MKNNARSLKPGAHSLLLAPLLLTSVAVAQPAGWNDPFPAHKVMDNLYFVGTKELASFLFVTDEGLILMNSNYEASVPVIQANVEALGFDFRDVKILISGHAHPDHIEGDALVKELTGAEVVVGRLEAPDVQAFRHPAGKTLPIDRIVDEGDTVTLGDVTLTAHVLPGHTKGCLAWTTQLEEDGETYDALVECSLNGQFLQYIDNPAYPDIAEDMKNTYVKARTLPAEVWVSSHGQFYGMNEKYEKLQSRGPGAPNPFIDPEGYLAHVEEFETSFEAALARQQAEAANK
ncbi:MAG TPA: MBL fold metallo-hydrolase [Pseudomonadales bacterium]